MVNLACYAKEVEWTAGEPGIEASLRRCRAGEQWPECCWQTVSTLTFYSVVCAQYCRKLLGVSKIASTAKDDHNMPSPADLRNPLLPQTVSRTPGHDPGRTVRANRSISI